MSQNLSTLSEWLDYIESLHSKEIEFGLQRVTNVYQNLFPKGLSSRVVTVAGTNGKGTTCAYIENILLAAGRSCGKHTSPHLLNFNERVNVAGSPVDDQSIVRAFNKVEQYRKNIELTYFEFTFLAALCVFEEFGVEFAICEVGLGGRLDAVNTLDPEVSVITMVGMDHMDWLGDDLQVIAVEKAGIARKGRPCVVGMKEFPESGLEYLQQTGAITIQNGINFSVNPEKKEWISLVENKAVFDSGNLSFEQSPSLAAAHLYENAACAVMAVMCLQNSSSTQFNVTGEHVRSGIESAQIIGRCQILQKSPLTVLDVAHNEDSIKALADFVTKKDVKGKTIAVFSMLKEKDIKTSLTSLIDVIDIWNIAELDTERAMSISEIEKAILELDENAQIVQFESISKAFEETKKTLLKQDCLVVFGSFWVVGDILRLC